MKKYYEFTPEELLEINGGDSISVGVGPVSYSHDVC